MTIALTLSGLKRRVLNEAASMEEGSRLSAERNFIQHGNTTVFEHSMNVAFLSLIFGSLISCLFRVDLNSLVRGSILHDYFLYDWHCRTGRPRLHGFHHPAIALANARQDFSLNPIEEDIIRNHMFPLVIRPPRFLEGWIITITDKICSLFETFKIDMFRWNGLF